MSERKYVSTTTFLIAGRITLSRANYSDGTHEWCAGIRDVEFTCRDEDHARRLAAELLLCTHVSLPL